jgi:hypothetical protein
VVKKKWEVKKGSREYAKPDDAFPLGKFNIGFVIQSLAQTD